MSRSPSNGYSIHIGLNGVDPDAYNGWPGTLAGCINDAKAMQQIADSVNYQSRLLTDAGASAQAVLDALSDAAGESRSGDIVIFTFSGHGGQLVDVSGDEPDEKDETLVLYDRMLLDDELYDALAQFGQGVRVIGTSDSCHSGTVFKEVYTQLTQFPPLAREYGVLPKRRGSTLLKNLPVELRRIPADVEHWNLEKNREVYSRLKRRTRGANPQASIILISGCQDNQLSADGQVNGLFTEKLLEVWDDGHFIGDYPRFRREIVAKMPPTQSPNLQKIGIDSPEFDAQKPFTVESPSAPTETGPVVTGPNVVERNGGPPTFDVVTGSNEYYVFEITSQPRLFNDENRHNGYDFYATWDDPKAPVRLTGPRFTLSLEAWDEIKEAERVWFRIGTTSSDTTWDDYTLSTEGPAGYSAPALDITGSRTR